MGLDMGPRAGEFPRRSRGQRLARAAHARALPVAGRDLTAAPGLITCAVARVARHVTGIDITPAMIDETWKRPQSMCRTNMEWRIGDVTQLPFPASSFSAVITRYSFHHFLEPQAVLKQMVRVCQPGGRVAVVDVFMSTSEQAEAYDRMEKLRDPSHTRAFLLAELTGMFHDGVGWAFSFVRLQISKTDVLSDPKGDGQRYFGLSSSFLACA